MAALLEAAGLYKAFPVRSGLFQTGRGHVRAVTNVSLTVRRGETVGVVGESGCGKTTLARMLLRLIEPDAGSIHFEGRSIAHLSSPELKWYRQHVQMVFQNPYESLNPRKSVRHILTQPLLVHGLCDRAEANRRAIKLLEHVGLRPGEQFLNRFPHQFSGGQRQRIGIARALALRPKLIIADEPVSSLDVSVRGEILNLLKGLQREHDLSYLFITHDLGIVRSFCDRVIVMYLGRVVEQGSVDQIFGGAKHPYTRALLSAIPWPDPVRARSVKRVVLSGDVPSPVNPPSGCHFHTRCLFAVGRCSTDAPVLEDYGSGHLAACHRVDELTEGQAKDRERAEQSEELG